MSELNEEPGSRLIRADNAFKTMMMGSDGLVHSVETKLQQIRTELRESSMKLKLQFGTFQRANSLVEGCLDVQDAIWSYIEKTSASVKNMEEMFNERIQNENNLKVQVVSTALHINENNDNLKKIIADLTRQINDMNKKMDSPELEVFRLRKIVSKKEKVIKKMKMNSFYKSNFFSLKQFDLLNRNMEMNKIITHFDEQIKSKVDLIKRTKDIIQNIPNEDTIKLSEDIDRELQNVMSIRTYEEIIESKIKNIPSINDQLHKLKINSEKFNSRKDEISRNKEAIDELNDRIFFLKKELEEITTSKTSPLTSLIPEKENEIVFNRSKIKDLAEINQLMKKETMNCRIEIIKSHNSNSQRLKFIKFLASQQISSMEKNLKTNKSLLKGIKSRYFNNTITSKRNLEIIVKFKELYKLNSLFKRMYIQLDDDFVKEEKEPREEPKKPIVVEEEKSDLKNKSRVKDLQEMVQQREKAMKAMSELSDTLKDMNKKLKLEIEQSQRIQEDNQKLSTGLNVIKGQLHDSLNDLKNLEIEKERLAQTLNEKDEKLIKCIREIEEKKKKMEKIKQEKEAMKKKIKENEELLAEKDKMMAELSEKLSEMQKKNEELKQNLDRQLRKMEEICKDSFTRYELTEDLIKQKKVFDQIYKHQNEKISIKDDKIKKMEAKIREYESQKSGVKPNPIKTTSKFKSAYDEVKELQAQASEHRNIISNKEDEIQKQRTEIQTLKERYEVEVNRGKKMNQKISHLEKIEIKQYQDRIFALTKLLSAKDEDSDQSGLLRNMEYDSLHSPNSFNLIGFSIRKIDFKCQQMIESLRKSIITIFESFHLRTTNISNKMLGCQKALQQLLLNKGGGSIKDVESLREQLRCSNLEIENLKFQIIEIEHQGIQNLEKYHNLIQETGAERNRLANELLMFHKQESLTSKNEELTKGSDSLNQSKTNDSSDQVHLRTSSRKGIEEMNSQTPNSSFSFKEDKVSLRTDDLQPKKVPEGVDVTKEGSLSNIVLKLPLKASEKKILKNKMPSITESNYGSRASTTISELATKKKVASMRSPTPKMSSMRSQTPKRDK